MERRRLLRQGPCRSLHQLSLPSATPHHPTYYLVVNPRSKIFSHHLVTIHRIRNRHHKYPSLNQCSNLNWEAAQCLACQLPLQDGNTRPQSGLYQDVNLNNRRTTNLVSSNRPMSVMNPYSTSNNSSAASNNSSMTNLASYNNQQTLFNNLQQWVWHHNREGTSSNFNPSYPKTIFPRLLIQ